MHSRLSLLEQVASLTDAVQGRIIVAVDGVDGSGKTTFADELAPLVEQRGRQVIRASVDGFHNSRALRYVRGKDDPEGFFLDSYDYNCLRKFLLYPFRSGAAIVDIARFDHRLNQKVRVSRRISPSAVLLLDGIFLHRDELREFWGFSVFLAVPFEVSYSRMAERDGSNPDPLAPGNRRYYEGQNIYLRSCKPEQRATVLIDNTMHIERLP